MTPRRHLSLEGPQRTAYLRQAALCLGLGVVPAAMRMGAWAFPVGWAALMAATAAYYVRVAYGWVQVDAVGLHTSRWWRGRHLRWDEIAGLEPKSWRGMGGGVTVVVARTVSGRSYYLPAPRTTTATTWAGFDRDLRRLSRHTR